MFFVVWIKLAVVTLQYIPFSAWLLHLGNSLDICLGSKTCTLEKCSGNTRNSQDSDKSYCKMAHNKLWNLTVQTVIANPVQSVTLLSSWNDVTLSLDSCLSSVGPWCNPVITDICVFIAAVGQVTARVWLWPLVHHLRCHGRTHHSMATQVSA